MALVPLTCPHCGFSKEMDETRLPPAGTRVNCPSCKGNFPLAVVTPMAPLSAAFSPDAFFEPPEPLGPERQPPSPPPPDAGAGGAGLPPLTPPSDFQRPPQPPLRRTLAFTFTGTAREYFGIWIVNTLLRIVTLGLYSPWAKVRKRRYFYGSTRLDDAPFDFLADPLAILKGWLIAAAFFGLYTLASRTSPIASAAMMLVFAGVFPWVIVRSRIFNLRNSSHRNIRFSFRPNYGEAYKVFLWWSLLVPFTLGILAPYVMYRQKRFLVENSSYGTTPFRFHATPKEYYRIFVPLFVTLLIGGALFGGMVLSGKVAAGKPYTGLMTVPIFFVFMAFYFIIGIWLPTAVANLTWSATSIGDHRFRCELRVLDLCWIYFSNAIAMPLSLGLLAPWATVRLAGYRLGKLSLTGVGGLDAVAAGAGEAVGATGEELGDMLGFDLGI